MRTAGKPAIAAEKCAAGERCPAVGAVFDVRQAPEVDEEAQFQAEHHLGNREQRAPFKQGEATVNQVEQFWIWQPIG